MVGVGLTIPEENKAAANDLLSDAWDFKGQPALRSCTGGWSAAAMILVVELMERLTTLGIAVNLVTYLTGTMHVGNAEGANIVTNFMGTSFMLCLLGGFIADTYLGRYLTIAIFAAVEAMGVTILTISTAAPGLRPSPCSGSQQAHSCPRASEEQLGVLYLALYTTALGTGGLKSSVSGLGSDQFDEKDQTERRRMTQFFSWFFFFISIGSLLAVTVLVYVQDNLGRPWGYGICAVAIAAGELTFLAGTGRYRFKKLVGSPLTQVATVVAAAWRKRQQPLPDDPAELYELEDLQVEAKAGAAGEVIAGKERQLGGRSHWAKQKLPHTSQFRWLDHAAIRSSTSQLGTGGKKPADEMMMNNKWRMATVTDVEEVKRVLRMLPVWATTIMFWTVYAQMTTFSVAQATTMDRRIGPSFQIPAGSLTVFFVGAILITVPIYDRIVVPISRRLTGNPHGLTPLQRISVGLVLSVLAMVAAALTEIKRLRAYQKYNSSSNDNMQAVISVFWLIPQFLLVGAGEAFTYIGQLDFFLRECPTGMKTMSTGLFLSTLSLGFFVSSALVAIVHAITGGRQNGSSISRPWLADDLNQGQLYNFYWLLAILCFANLVVYLMAANWYKYKEQDHPAGPLSGDDEESIARVELSEAEACYH